MKTFSKIPDENESSRLIDCPVCGSSDFTDHWESAEASWRRCCSCSLVLQNPQPRPADILKRYDEEYFSYETDNEDAFLKLMLLGLDDISFFDLTEDGEKSFLDIGCATGRLCQWLNQRGWDARGVEVCKEAAAWGREQYGVDIFPGTVDEAAFPAESFRFVHSSHVIEHVNEPDRYLEEIYRILRPGGYCLCATPNSDGFQARLFGSRWRSAIADHLFLFSKKTLKNLAFKKGFELRKLKTWGGLGAGYAPLPIKKIADKGVKVLGTGDVMLLLLQKPYSA